MVVALFEWFWESLDDWNEFLNEHPLVRELDDSLL